MGEHEWEHVYMSLLLIPECLQLACHFSYDFLSGVIMLSELGLMRTWCKTQHANILALVKNYFCMICCFALSVARCMRRQLSAAKYFLIKWSPFSSDHSVFQCTKIPSPSLLAIRAQYSFSFIFGDTAWHWNLCNSLISAARTQNDCLHTFMWLVAGAQHFSSKF